MPDYGFRPMIPADLPMFKRWLDQPHMGGWWADGATEARLVAEEFGQTRVDMRIVTADGIPFAFVQDYDAMAFDAPQYVDLPRGARAIDTFLGDPAYLGQGHAGAYLRQRAAALRQTAPLVAVDPSPANARAIAAYTRAGFAFHRLTPCEDGDMVHVMTYR